MKYRDQNIMNQRIAEWEARGKVPRIVELTESDVAAQKNDAEI